MDRRSAWLTFATVALLLILAGSTAFLVAQGFQRAQNEATRRSADELLAQTEANLTELVSLEAQIYDAQLQRDAELTQIAARYVLSATNGDVAFRPASAHSGTITSTAQLTLSPDKTLLFDANPRRRSEVLHPAWRIPDASVERSLRLSAPLEDVMPALFSASSDAVTIYYQGPQLTFRSYPVRNLPQIALEAGIAEQSRMEALERSPTAGPMLARNAGRRTIWQPPYIDDGGNGLVVSVYTPIYVRDDYLGYIGLDITLADLVARLEQFKPISGSVMFLIDQQGKLVAMPISQAHALFGDTLTATTSLADVFSRDIAVQNPNLAPVAAAMRAGETGARLFADGKGGDTARQSLIIYAPLPNLHWSAGLLVPLAQINSRAREVTGAIQQDADSTVRSTLIALGVFFLIAMGGVAILNRRQFQQAQHIAVLEERQRLSRELHDSVSQALYAIALNTRSARTFLNTAPNRVADTLDQVAALAKAGLTEMRALIFELRPESLEQDGLVAALTRQAEALQARYETEIRVIPADEPPLTTARREALYRIAQEALTNAVKHTQATAIVLEMRNTGPHFELTVRDNGAGFDPGGTFPGHLGLRSMKERAERVGGSLTIESVRGAEQEHGTTVRVQMPL